MLTIEQHDMRYETALKLINKDRDPKGRCIVKCMDGDAEMPVKAMILHLPFWQVYKSLGYDIYKKHIFFDRGPYNKSVYKKIMHRIYRDITNEEENDIEYFKRVKEALWQCINNIDDFGTMELDEYLCTCSIIDLAEIATDPKVQELRNVDIDESNGTVIIKQRLSDANKKFIELLSHRGNLPNDNLTDFIEIGALKNDQVGQCILSYGLRTEIDDKLMRRPVHGSSISGYMDILDYALDNQAARKSIYMTHDAIRKSQYTSRKFAILMSILQQLYKKPCGTKTLLPWMFTEENYNKCFGKIFVLKDKPDEEFILTDTNFEKFLNKEILMYSPMTCTHQNGICSKCFGILSKNYTEGINIGISCASNLTAIISQLILSTKHYNTATPEVYAIPEGAVDFFRNGKNGLWFTQPILKNLKNLELGVFYKDIHGSISDLQQMSDELDVPVHRYSSIESILFKDKKSGNISELVLTNEGMTPHLTIAFLRYMKSKFSEMEQDKEVLWIPMDESLVKQPIPILNSVIKNNSMMTYVENITNFVEKTQLQKYHDASLALKDFSNLIFDKVKDINIVQIEALLRAHMVTSNTNYMLPVVTDTKKVIFKKTKDCISERTIAGQLIFEKHNLHFAEPRTYCTLKEPSVFDAYFNL